MKVEAKYTWGIEDLYELSERVDYSKAVEQILHGEDAFILRELEKELNSQNDKNSNR